MAGRAAPRLGCSIGRGGGGSACACPAPARPLSRGGDASTPATMLRFHRYDSPPGAGPSEARVSPSSSPEARAAPKGAPGSA
eukprot:CAMPEP_0119137936 /NCGR_PEP_ID=MMETSP1310-20130426/24691_1 /TAXON_ID=464262 /ORGANISM="Genus nov. species nov., Strain RCC2339" /LENGTH=81 /DNA_ID=CAMNT_0007129081 /DNA_START=78 /DNA_END=320 /DNA_ORIENTATION=+